MTIRSIFLAFALLIATPLFGCDEIEIVLDTLKLPHLSQEAVIRREEIRLFLSQEPSLLRTGPTGMVHACVDYFQQALNVSQDRSLDYNDKIKALYRLRQKALTLISQTIQSDDTQKSADTLTALIEKTHPLFVSSCTESIREIVVTQCKIWAPRLLIASFVTGVATIIIWRQIKTQMRKVRALIDETKTKTLPALLETAEKKSEKLIAHKLTLLSEHPRIKPLIAKWSK